MKIKKLTFGFVAAGFFLTLSTISGFMPVGTSTVVQGCDVKPMLCAAPQNLTAANFPLQNW